MKVSGPAVHSGRLLFSTYDVQEKLFPTVRRVKKGWLHRKWTSVTPSSPLWSMARLPPSGSRPPHYRGFTITLRYTTLGRTTLDEWSAWCKNICLTTHNIHKKQTTMPLAAFEPAFPASERSQTHALDCAATGFGTCPLASHIIVENYPRSYLLSAVEW